MEEPTTPKPSETPPLTATVEQIEAVNARLDSYERDQRRAKSRAVAQAFGERGVQQPPPKPIMWREDDPAMADAGIDAKHAEDAETKSALDTTRDALTQLAEAAAQLEGFEAHMTALANGLEYSSGPHRALHATTFGAEREKTKGAIDKLCGPIAQRIDRVAKNLEQQEKSHASLARAAIQVPVATHIAQEIRTYFRQLEPTARHAAILDAVQGGDRETLGALLEKGVPRYLLGIKAGDSKSFDQLIDGAERTMAPEHVARRDAARKLRERLNKAWNRFMGGNFRVSELMNLRKHPNAARRMQDPRNG